jgi:hypothetical protein
VDGWPHGQCEHEDVHATIDAAAMVGACLVALAGDRHRDAAVTLRAMAERATSPRGRRAGLDARAL